MYDKEKIVYQDKIQILIHVSLVYHQTCLLVCELLVDLAFSYQEIHFGKHHLQLEIVFLMYAIV